MQGGTSSRGRFLTIYFWAFSLAFDAPFLESWLLQSFPFCDVSRWWPEVTSSRGCCLLWIALCAGVWLFHLSHWLWAAADRGFCPPFPQKLSAGSACWMDLPHCHGMSRSDAKLGERQRKGGQDKCISRAAPFRGNLPLPPMAGECQTIPCGTWFPLLAVEGFRWRALSPPAAVLAVVPSLRDRWLSHATAAEPPLASLGSLAPGLLFLDTPRCHSQWSSSCSGSSPALWLAAMGQTAVSGKPYSCLAAGRGTSHSHRFPGAHPYGSGEQSPLTVLPVPPGVQMQWEIFW